MFHLGISLKRVVYIHSKLCSIIHMATKVHVIVQSHVVLTWMYDALPTKMSELGHYETLHTLGKCIGYVVYVILCMVL